MNSFLKSSSLLAPLACGLLPALPAAPSAKPNIVFILADDLGYGEISLHGQKRYETPNIDRLARDGMTFTQAYAGAPVCAPSRNTLMTGQHTGHCTVRNNTSVTGVRVGLSPSDITIAQRLRAAGYHTAIIGKWGLGEEGTGSEPGDKGWDFFYGFINQAHAHNQFPEFLYRNTGKDALVPNYSRTNGVFANDRFTDEAFALLEKHAADKKPFFLFMSYTTPHAELRCPPDSIAEVRQKHAWAREPGADEKQIQFAAMMLRLDREVGRLHEKLSALGLAENTIIFFTGDNGAHQEDGKAPAFFNSGGIYRGIKRDLYEGGMHEPFLACWPGRIAPGSRTDHLCAFWDIPATLLELAGIPAAGLPAESVSFAPTLLGKSTAQKKHDYLYWEFTVKNHARQAVRADNWKAVRYRLDAPLEIYDIIADPGEQHDLAAAHPGLVARFEKILTDARADSADFPLRPPVSNTKKNKK